MAKLLTSPDNPWFAKAYVNRMWAMLMGWGFYPTVNDLGTNITPRHGETLALLAKEWTATGYDMPWLFRTITATEAYQRAAWSYHLGKFLWFEDRELHEELVRLTVDAYRKALPGLDPAGERVELPFEGAVVPGILRRPRGVARAPLVLMVPGLDSVKEELFTMEEEFLKRGMATLSVDGPGQGENERRFPIRPDWSGVVTAILDGLGRRDDLDLGRVGLMGISMGGIYGPFAAAKEKRLRAPGRTTSRNAGPR